MNSEKSFEQAAGKSILESAEISGITLPYSCRTGRCSSCKCKVLSGNTLEVSPELGLTESEKLEGWILGCVRVSLTDVELLVDDYVDIPMYKPNIVPCKISTLRHMIPDVMKVILRLPPNIKLGFYPGQYVDLISGEGVTRSYSIANAPEDDNLIELHVKRVSGGSFSNYWFRDAKEDDLLRLKGPLGTFFLRDIYGKDVVFLATGTGIAPVKAMLDGLKSLPEEAKPKSVTVYWGARIPEDLYLDEFHDNASCLYVPVVSRPPTTWVGSSGYVQDVFMASSPDLSQTVVYACGSDLMIKSAQNLLGAAGLLKNNFFSDAFVSSSPI